MVDWCSAIARLQDHPKQRDGPRIALVVQQAGRCASDAQDVRIDRPGSLLEPGRVRERRQWSASLKRNDRPFASTDARRKGHES